MPENNGIEDKIKKLLSLALNNPNAAEAEAAMVKARELMIKHAVDEAKLHGEETASDTDVYIINLDRTFESWMKIVQMSVAKLYGGLLYLGKRRSEHRNALVDVAHIVCSASDIALLKETYAQVVATILRESARHTDGRASAFSFRTGAADGFLAAVEAANTAPLNKAGTAIVLVRSEAIKKKADEMFPHAKHKSLYSSASDSDAYNRGYAFGSRMDTGKVTKKLVDSE